MIKSLHFYISNYYQLALQGNKLVTATSATCNLYSLCCLYVTLYSLFSSYMGLYGPDGYISLKSYVR